MSLKGNQVFILHLVHLMTPSKIRLRIQSQMKRVSNRDDATKYFERQKEALFGIRDTG